MSSLFLVLALSLLAACSQGGKGSPVAFRLTLGSMTTHLGVNSEGGFVIYGKSSTGAAFGRVITAEGPITMDLPNGTWTFYSLAWKGDGNGTYIADTDALKGEIRCAETAPVTLNGAPTSIPLNLTNAQCDTTTFKGALSMAGSAPLNFRAPNLNFCNDLTGVVGPASTCVYDLSTKNFTRGYASGLRLGIRSFEMSPGGVITWRPGELVGSCFADDGTTMVGLANVDVSSTGSYNVPHNTSFPMGLLANAFYGTTEPTACSNAYGSSEISMPFGPLSTASVAGVDTVKGYLVAGTSLHTFLRVDEKMACTATKANPNDWAGGYGNLNAPNLVCQDSNLDPLRGANYLSNASAHVILLRNLNYWYGLDPNSAGPPQVAPFGETLPTAATAYNGSFNGNGKLIIGWNYKVPSTSDVKDNVGLFRALGASAEVFNFTMIAPELRKDFDDRIDNVGIIAGRSLGKVMNITVRGAQVQGSANVGGLVGRQDSSTPLIRECKVYDSEIEGAVNVGGLIGYNAAWGSTGSIVLESGTYETQVGTNSDRRGRCVDLAINNAGCTPGNQWEQGFCTLTSVTQEQFCTTPVTAVWLQGNAVGGLIGKADDANIPTISRSRAGGLITAHSMAGGLIGKASGDVTIEDSYSVASVVTTTDSTITSFRHRAGGLVGKWFSSPGTLIINRAYHDKGGVNHLLPDSLPLVGEGTYTASADLALAHTTATPGTSVNGVTNTMNYGEAGMYADASYNTNWDVEWIHYDPGFAPPILQWEDVADHPCIGKRSALTGGGTAANPYNICTRAQFLGLASATATSHYKLLDDIDFRDSTATNAVNNFAGTLYGNRHGLTNFYKSGIANAAIFGTVASSGKLLNFFTSNIYIDAPNIDGGAAVAVTNQGLIDRSLVYGFLKLKGQVGGVVRTNEGVILRTEANVRIDTDSTSASSSEIGGMVSSNAGIIGLSESRSQIKVTSNTNATAFVGGIAGSNDGALAPAVTAEIATGDSVSGSGLIFESTFDGAMNFSGSAAITEIGGLIGQNRSAATVRDCLAEWSLRDFTNNATNSTLNLLGGLGGSLQTSSLLDRSWSRIDSQFSQNANPSLLYPAAPSRPEATNLYYLDSASTNYASFDAGSGSRVITQAGTNDLPAPGDLYSPNLATYAGWDISDDEDDKPTWLLHSGDLFGPRLFRVDDRDDHMTYFNTYGQTLP